MVRLEYSCKRPCRFTRGLGGALNSYNGGALGTGYSSCTFIDDRSVFVGDFSTFSLPSPYDFSADVFLTIRAYSVDVGIACIVDVA